MSARILIVDDDEMIVELFSLLLKSHGYDVLKARNGKEGVEKVKTENPDLILLDLMMPEMDGLQVCQHVRAFSQIPIIIISALDHPAMIAQALDAGADDYLVKPVPSGVLMSRIARLLWRTGPLQNGTPELVAGV
ncbi:MAG: response regulator [Anaerolineales bacterium]